MRVLGKYSTGVNQGPGFITSHLQGRTIESLLIDGTNLVIRFTDGHEAVLGWQDKSGNRLNGEPFLETLNVRLVLPGAAIVGKANL